MVNLTLSKTATQKLERIQRYSGMVRNILMAWKSLWKEIWTRYGGVTDIMLVHRRMSQRLRRRGASSPLRDENTERDGSGKIILLIQTVQKIENVEFLWRRCAIATERTGYPDLIKQIYNYDRCRDSKIEWRARTKKQSAACSTFSMSRTENRRSP